MVTVMACGAHARTHLENCLEIAKDSAHIFSLLQDAEAKIPGTREQTIEAVRQATYGEIKRKRADGSVLAEFLETKRMYFEIAVKNLYAEPSAKPERIERLVYERCATSR